MPTKPLNTPMVFDVLSKEAVAVSHTPFGSVGELFSGHGIRAVWVEKQGEEIDPGWFCQDAIDVIVVIQGGLKLEFADSAFSPVELRPGSVLLLPPNTRCRGYRWPRQQAESTVFLAVYPFHPESGSGSEGL